MYRTIRLYGRKGCSCKTIFAETIIPVRLERFPQPLPFAAAAVLVSDDDDAVEEVLRLEAPSQVKKGVGGRIPQDVVVPRWFLGHALHFTLTYTFERRCFSTVNYQLAA